MDRWMKFRSAILVGSLALVAMVVETVAVTIAPVGMPVEDPEFVQVPMLRESEGASLVIRQDVSERGDVVSNGRYSLIIPPGAIQGSARIELRVPDHSVMKCEIHISPPEANDFRKPVYLVADCSGGNYEDPSSLRTLWHDEAKGVWVPLQGSIVDPNTQTIRTPLWHFSEYGNDDGKAGW